MLRRFQWVFLTALFVAGNAALPLQAEASDDSIPCTRGYMKCLNDSYDTQGLFRIMADLECGVRYAACLVDAIIG